MNREETLLKAANLFLTAEKIENRINWNNDAQRDSQIGKRDNILFNALWEFNKAMYCKKEF